MIFAVLGLGSIGLRHARNLLARGQSVVGYDPEAGRRKALADLGGTAAESRTAALAAATAAVIASPNAQHLDDLRDCIDAGLHVLVEKPISHSRDGVSDVLARAAANGLVVFCGFNLRFHPCVAEAKAMLTNGAIGRPVRAAIECGSYLPDWRPGADYRKGYAADAATGGVVFDVIHEIDLALHLLGEASVMSASAGRSGLLDMPSEDVADFVLLHTAGARSAVHLDYVSRPPVRQTRIVSSDGTLLIDLLARRLQCFAADGTVAADTTHPGGFADDYGSEIDAFLARMEGRPADGATGEDGLRALDVALAVREKAGLPSA